VAEPLGEQDRIVCGAEYLQRTLALLRQRPDSPKQVKDEPRATIGGLVYDQLSLTRPWSEGEVGTTIWAVVTRGHALTITGSYRSPEGLRAIEELLTGMSADVPR
jgi:hypothetical protein